MDTVPYIRKDLGWAHELLEMVMQDATQEQLDWHPPGKANPLGATYAHAICAEDAIVHTFLMDKQPLFESQWQGRTGISDPRPSSEYEWAREVKVDLPTAREYAEAVYGITDSHLASLDSAGLDRTVDLTDQGFGEKSVSWIIGSLLVSHANNMAGEASVLKGLQGAKGYPW